MADMDVYLDRDHRPDALPGRRSDGRLDQQDPGTPLVPATMGAQNDSPSQAAAARLVGVTRSLGAEISHCMIMFKTHDYADTGIVIDQGHCAALPPPRRHNQDRFPLGLAQRHGNSRRPHSKTARSINHPGSRSVRPRAPAKLRGRAARGPCSERTAVIPRHHGRYVLSVTGGQPGWRAEPRRPAMPV